jgi:hypothetical protein
MLYQILSGLLATAIVFLVVALVMVIARNGDLRKALTRTGELADNAQKAAAELGTLAQQQSNRADAFFGIIEGIEHERDGWQNFYRESSRAAGVAQGWLARELQRVVVEANNLSAELRKRGIKAPTIEVDPNLKGVLEDFNVHSEGKNELPREAGMVEARQIEEASKTPEESTQTAL